MHVSPVIRTFSQLKRPLFNAVVNDGRPMPRLCCVHLKTWVRTIETSSTKGQVHEQLKHSCGQIANALVQPSHTVEFVPPAKEHVDPLKELKEHAALSSNWSCSTDMTKFQTR